MVCELGVGEFVAGFSVFEVDSAAARSSSGEGRWKPGDGGPLGVRGLAWVGPDRLGVTVRKGEVLLLDGVLAEERS